MRVVGITRISLSDIKVGSFIGTTTVPGPDGEQNAVEVHVFPENMRGTGEGSRPYDLRPNSTMTNATVAETVAGNDGHTLMVKYKDGEKKVVVSPDTPVVTYVPADKSDLKAGAKVIAFMKKLPDGIVRNQPRQCRPRRADAADVRVARRPRNSPRVAVFPHYRKTQEGDNHAEYFFVKLASARGVADGSRRPRIRGMGAAAAAGPDPRHHRKRRWRQC